MGRVPCLGIQAPVRGGVLHPLLLGRVRGFRTRMPVADSLRPSVLGWADVLGVVLDSLDSWSVGFLLYLEHILNYRS